VSARKKSPLPAYEPQLALLVDDAPEGDEWLHELKFDGYRIGVRINHSKVELLSRRAKDWTEAFPTVVAGARKLGATTALIDGELAGILPDGRTSLHAMGGNNLAFFAFDLLHVDGENLFALPLVERKQRLAAFLGAAPPAPFRYVEHVAGDGGRFFKEACAMRLEGIVSKARAAPYKPGARNATWRKVKCVLRQEFVIGGYEHSVVGGLGSLWLGTYDDAGRLEFAGKVGTGFQREAPALMRKLAGMKRPTTPFGVGLPVGAAKLRDAHWVEPTLVCEVAFLEWTGHGHIRHPSFQGMRADKKPRDVRREFAFDVPEGERDS
jgi:bifunctional non-homologous end joining protein LigD